MRTTQQLSITLPIEMAKQVKDRVSSGAYATESEVIREGLRMLDARDVVINEWLRTTVVPAAVNLESNPDSALTADQVRKNLAQLREHKK
ncbi:ribbon-helix-helix domain-containing protein [Serratia ureilytica]|uniref:Antitoxin ParD n=1 Tax=Serratia ureilytica TaxID=300181 RepID=A0A9X9G0C0_9GAMM|nr:type II toxin-antitoxin system ParD family antitoxin [Serratia ureilytica]TXE22168.1 type II toxin-antitoxin system ParD family antitoxin [Serratia ureilytica]